MQRIGLFGGTFDPPHLAHVRVSKTALQKCVLDRVIFIPCRNSPLKTEPVHVSGHHRHEMLKLTLQHAGEKKFEVSTIELDRKEESFSYLTAEFFHAKYPQAQLFWIIGSDQWNDIEKWQNLPRLVQLVTFVIYPRPHAPQPKPDIPSISLDAPPVDISATAIRSLLKQKQLPTSFLAPSVLTYIRKENLYH